MSIGMHDGFAVVEMEIGGLVSCCRRKGFCLWGEEEARSLKRLVLGDWSFDLVC